MVLQSPPKTSKQISKQRCDVILLIHSKTRTRLKTSEIEDRKRASTSLDNLTTNNVDEEAKNYQYHVRVRSQPPIPILMIIVPQLPSKHQPPRIRGPGSAS